MSHGWKMGTMKSTKFFKMKTYIFVIKLRYGHKPGQRPVVFLLVIMIIFFFSKFRLHQNFADIQ